MRGTCFLITCIAILYGCPALSADNRQAPQDIAEQQLFQTYTLAENGDWDRATHAANALCKEYPEFHAATLLQDFINRQQIPDDAKPVKLKEQDDEYIAGNLQAELSLRVHAIRDRPQPDRIPDSIVKLNNAVDYALLVDLNKSRLYLLKHSSDVVELIADYYAGIGRQGIGKQKRGDMRTPTGIYHITGKLLDRNLPELYGAGALPLNYPNTWDRLMQRTGDGIWIHGVPRDTYSRPPYSSLGCVTLSNAIYSGITSFVKPGVTPVILDNNVDWIEPGTQREFLHIINDAFQQWQQDWSSLDFDRYAAHYSTRFSTGSENFNAWRKRKKYVNQNKTFIHIEQNNINIFRYPGEDALVQIDYRQTYASNNFTAVANKQQYWRRESDGIWRIVYEGLQ